MFIPIHDGKPIRHISLQWVTLALISLNVLVYVVVNLSALAGPQQGEALVLAFGHVPSVSNDLRSLPLASQIIPDKFYVITGVTYAFLHADLWHLGGNMLFLWVFGDNVEDAMGHFKFLLFYILCGAAAAWFHAFSFSTSDAPLIGASGAAAGIVAAYLMLHPKMKVWVLFLGRIPLRLPAIFLLGGWVAFQLWMYISDGDSAVSWAAHVGGIMAGVLLVGVLKRRQVPLFDREILVPGAVDLNDDAVLPDNVRPGSWGRKGAA